MQVYKLKDILLNCFMTKKHLKAQIVTMLKPMHEAWN